MSWYNDTDNSFIDATQTFEGGSGNIVNGGDGSGANSQLSDILELKLDYFENEYEEPQPTLVYNLYLKNNNTEGEIRFLTEDAKNNNDVSNNALKYNVKIGTDGKLYLYYTYNPLISALTTSKWIDVITYIVGNATGIANNQAQIALASGALLTLQQEVSVLQTTVLATSSQVGGHEIRIQVLERRTTVQVDEVQQFSDEALSEQLRDATEELGDMFDAGNITVNNFTSLFKFLRSRKGIVSGVSALLGIGGTISGIALVVQAIIDAIEKNDNSTRVNILVNSLDTLESNTDKNTVDKLYIDGLVIQPLTNTGGLTDGVYEVDTQNDGKLQITVSSGTANITEILQTGGNFSSGDTITVAKNNIGGTTGNLVIDVNNVYSLVEIIELELIKLNTENNNIDNRNRRRQFIPDKNDFNNGLEVTETNVTEPSGEITKSLDISLKLDTSQFNYDATGNLQLTNYSQIAQNQSDILTNTTNIATNSGNIATNTADIATNSGNISSIDTRTTNLETYTANLQTQINNNDTDIANNASAISANTTTINNNLFVTNFAISTNTQSINTINQTITGIQTDITSLESENDDVYKLLLNNNETFSTTTDHIVNIGFNKTEFNNVLFNLIMGAVKLNSPTLNIPFSITDFSGYYFGTYPNMERLNYNEVITLVKQDNSKYYNDINWNNGGLVQMGAYYFTNVSTGVVYDLNKRLEWYGNIRFRTRVSGNNYILRTGLEYEDEIEVPQYQPDNNKLSFYIRDDKFYFSHLCKYDITYHAIRLTQNVLIDFLNPIATFVSVTPSYGNSEGYLRLNITTSPFNEDLYFTIDEGFDSVTKTTIESLINTGANNNPLFCGMVQDYATTNHNPFGMVQLQYSTYTSGNLYKIARLEIEYQIMRHDGTYQGGTWIPNGWIPAIPSTQQDLNNMYEELVFEFYNSYTDTTPAETILIDTRQIYSTTTNTIIIDFDKSPDLYTYTFEKWIIRPRFNASFSGGYPTLPSGSGYTLYPNQRSAFIHKVKMFPYIQKTETREKVEEFTDDITHTIDVFTYNKLNLHFGLNRSQIPYQDIWYKLNDNATKNIITIPNNFITTQLSDLTDLPPNITQLQTDNINFTQPFFVSLGQNAITESNHILIVGDEDTGSEIYITHHGWRYLLPTDTDMTETNLNDFDYLIPYNYYHRTAICDRFLSCKEFYADVIDFKRLLIDGNLSYDDMTTSEFSTLSNSSDGIAIKSLASVNIQNLYGLTQNGFVQFDTINGFSTTTSGGGGGTNYWTLVGSTKITYPYTIEVDRVNTNTIVFPFGSPSSSITFSDGSSLLTANGLSYYTDADVRSVLQASASATISWDATNNFLVIHQNVLSDISNNGVNITTLQGGLGTANINIGNNSTAITNLNNLIEDVSGSTKIKATSDIIFENNSLEKMRLDVNGNLGIGVNPPVEPIDFQQIQNGWFKINNFGQILMRNTQSANRWNISIRNSGLFSISNWGGGGQHDNGVMPSQYNKLSILPNGNVGIDNNNPSSKLDVNGNITCLGLTFTSSLNGLTPTTFNYLANVTSDIQTQINNISSYTDTDVKNILALSGGNNITWNTTSEQFDLDSQITTDISNNGSSITTLQTDLGTANNNISNNSSAITTLQTNLGTANTNIANNASSITTLQTNLGTANTNIANNASSITTLNNLIYDDTNANTTYIDGLNNFVVNLNGTQSFKCQPNLLEIKTPPTSTGIPFFRLVQTLNNHQGQFYMSGFGNNDLVMDRVAGNNLNSGLALRVGGVDKIRVDGTGAIVIPNQIGTGNPTNSSYGLEIQHGTVAITGSGSFLLENGSFAVGSLSISGLSIFDVNSSSGSFTRINSLAMFLIKNHNNANRYQIGIRNNGNLCIGNDTSTNNGTMGAANDKMRLTPSGEVQVRYNLKVGEANGALLTEISLLNLPTSAPPQANRVWRDSSGFLRIT